MNREPRAPFIYTVILVLLPWLCGLALWMIFR